MNSEANGYVVGDLCPRCDSKIVSRKGKYGPFLGCSAFPQCKWKPKGQWTPEKEAARKKEYGPSRGVVENCVERVITPPDRMHARETSMIAGEYHTKDRLWSDVDAERPTDLMLEAADQLPEAPR